MRGNVDTRLRRLGEGAFDAIVLAAAGLARLGREGGVPLAPELMVPAPGQGCLALEARTADERVRVLTRPLDHVDSHRQLLAERAVAHRLDAGCQTPLGVHARPQDDGGLRLSAFVGRPDGSKSVRASLAGRPSAPEALGIALAEILLAEGAGELLGVRVAAPYGRLRRAVPARLACRPLTCVSPELRAQDDPATRRITPLISPRALN